MSYPAEAQIAREIFKFVANGLLYRGSKPVMWSVVEKTALAEAEVEYEDHDQRHDLCGVPGLDAETPVDVELARSADEQAPASIVIWTTTPWTIPGQSRDRFLQPRSPTASTRVTAPAPSKDNLGDSRRR